MVNLSELPTKLVCLQCFWGDKDVTRCHCPQIADIKKMPDGRSIGQLVDDDLFEACLDILPPFSETEYWIANRGLYDVITNEKPAANWAEEYKLLDITEAALVTYRMSRDGRSRLERISNGIQSISV